MHICVFGKKVSGIIFPGSLLLFEQVRHREQQQSLSDRLLQIGLRAGLQAFYPAVNSRLGRQHHYWNVRSLHLFLDFFAQSDTIHLRHHNVRYNQVHIFFFREFHRNLSAWSGAVFTQNGMSVEAYSKFEFSVYGGPGTDGQNMQVSPNGGVSLPFPGSNA